MYFSQTMVLPDLLMIPRVPNLTTVAWDQTQRSSPLHFRTSEFDTSNSKFSTANNYPSYPYVTDVGATKVYPRWTFFEPESGVVDPAGQPYLKAFSSGGGFSNIFPQPNSQADAVSSFFENHNPPYPYYEGNGLSGVNNDGLHNRLGRG
jgi:hypothetical protein